jgi:hypothetical protein
MDLNEQESDHATGLGPYASEREKLRALNSLDSWTLSESEPDIRGWRITTVNDRQLGTVHDLLIDTDAAEVVLIDVELPGGNRHTFVPIRVVQIDRARRAILMDSADLPTSSVERPAGGPSPAGRRASDTLNSRTVRYPRSSREVVVERPAIVDDAPPRDSVPSEDFADGAVPDRRRTERRRIHRMSTGI